MRGSLVRVVVALVATVALAGCWLQPSFDAEQSSFNPSDNAVTPANVGGLHQLWSTLLPSAPVNDPVVSTNGVYATAGISPGAGTVALLAASGGTVQWSRQLFAPKLSTVAGDPTLAGTSVYVPVNSSSNLLENDVQVLDAASGTPGTAIGYSMRGRVIARGTKLVGTDLQCTDTNLCVSTLTVYDTGGNGTWYTDLDVGQYGLDVPSTPAVGPDHVFIGRDGNVEGWTLAKPANCTTQGGQPFCSPAWSKPVGGDIAGHPVVSADDSVVYAASGTQLFAFAASDGTQLWAATLGSTAAAAPAVTNGYVYVPTSSGDLQVFAANGCGQSTCSASWTDQTGSAISTTPAVVSGGVVYVASADGNLRAYSSSGCGSATCTTALKTLATGSTVTGGPVAALGHLYVGTTDGHVVAYGL